MSPLVSSAGANRSFQKRGVTQNGNILHKQDTPSDFHHPCLSPGKLSFLSVQTLARVIFVCVDIQDLCPSLGLVTAMFGTAGTLMNVSKRGQNLGKVRAHSLRP